jgi:hypothetical protein
MTRAIEEDDYDRRWRPQLPPLDTNEINDGVPIHREPMHLCQASWCGRPATITISKKDRPMERWCEWHRP